MCGVRGLCLLLLITVAFAATNFPDEFETCSRVHGDKRVLAILMDGTRGDILHANLGSLRSFRTLIANGKYQPCTAYNDPQCATTALGNRYNPWPLGSQGLGIKNYSVFEVSTLRGQFAEFYHWYTLPGMGSILSGLDTAKTQAHFNAVEDAANLKTGMDTYGGSFVSKAKNSGLTTACSGVPSLLTGDWSINDGRSQTAGAIDVECGMTENGTVVQPTDTHSCNCDYRHSIPNAEYAVSHDNSTRDFAQLMIQRGCAEVIVVHLNLPDYMMHMYGIGSAEYNASLIQMDHILGLLLSDIYVDYQTYDTEWLVTVTADHGGKEWQGGAGIILPNGNYAQRLDHNDNYLYDEVVPFIVSGFGGVGIEDFVGRPRVVDIYPTILEFLEIEYDADVIDGRAQGFEVSAAANVFLSCGSFLLLVVALFHL